MALSAILLGLVAFLPIESQAPLARALRNEAAEQDKELSANFIHPNFLVLLAGAKKQERAMKSQKEAERLRWEHEAIQREKAANYCERPLHNT